MDYVASYLGKTVKDFAPYKHISEWDSCLAKICWIVKWADRWDSSKSYQAMFEQHSAHLAKDSKQLLY